MLSESVHEDEEAPEVKYIDSLDFQRWTEDEDFGELFFRWIDSLEIDEPKWHRLLTEFVSSLAGKHGFRHHVIEKYAKTFQSLGAEVTRSKGWLQMKTKMAPRAISDKGSLPVLLANISRITRDVNLAQYLATTLNTVGQSKTRRISQKLLSRERLSTLYLYQKGYLQGLETILSNHRLLRHFRYGAKKRADQLTRCIETLFLECDIYTQAPEASSLALQAVLSDWNCPIQSEKILQIAHGNTLQMRALLVKGDAYYFLNESLICALALNYPQAQEEMDDFDRIITPTATLPRGKQMFNFWRMISRYERGRREQANPQGFMLTAMRLEDESKLEGEAATVMIETACQIRKQCGGQNDEILKTITETVTRHPALGPRMLQLAEHCGVGYENEVLLHQICDPEDPEAEILHPSEFAWLDYVEKLVHVVGRYGSVQKTMTKSLKIMFEFLDFDSNRFNERAWILIEKVLELSDPSFVLPEWRTRMDWWPKFQRSKARDGRKLAKSVRETRKAVLGALEEIVV